jgi:hypothetical protein
MAIQSPAATTVNPQKWLGMLQRWCPAAPTADLVAFINLLIEAAGSRRAEWLDDLIVQADNQLRRTGAWKMNRLKQYAEVMSKNPRHLPRLRKLRGSRDFDVALKILETTGRGMSADEVLPAFRRHRAITRGALVNVLISMTRIGRIERYSDGIYGVPRSGGERYESGTRLIFKLALAVPETTRAALCAATGYSRARVGAAINNLRKRGLFDPSRISVSAEARTKTERGETIFNKKGKVFWALEVSPAAPVEAAVFTALRAERLPLEDAEVEAEIERLKALPRAEYEAQREAAASRLGMRHSVLDRLRSDGAKEDVGRAIPQRAAALTAVPPLTVISRAERKAMREASLKVCEERYFQLIEAQSDRAPEARAVLEKKMMNDCKVTRDETRYCRAKAIRRYNSLHPDNPCKWGDPGR